MQPPTQYPDVPAVPAEHHEQAHKASETPSDATDHWKDPRPPEAMQPLDSFSWREGSFEVTTLLMDRTCHDFFQMFARQRACAICEGETDLLALYGPVLRQQPSALGARARCWEGVLESIAGQYVRAGLSSLPRP